MEYAGSVLANRLAVSKGRSSIKLFCYGPVVFRRHIVCEQQDHATEDNFYSDQENNILLITPTTTMNHVILYVGIEEETTSAAIKQPTFSYYIYSLWGTR